MGKPGTVPATLWRAFFLSVCLTGVSLIMAAPAGRNPPPLTQFGKLDPTEARTALDQLRKQGIAGDYFLELQVRVMPRRGAERLIRGQLWGGRNQIGPLTRVNLAADDSGSIELRLLVQNGAESGAWRWRGERGVEKLSVASLFEPLIPDTELTAFDLQMPFIFWERFEYQGLARFRGRPAHVLVLRPPADFATRHPALTGVRVHLDTQFNALVQTELLGENGLVMKTLSLVDLKRIGEQWIPKTFDLRDERTRNKTRVSVTGAALELDFTGTLFEPAMLAESVQPPDPARVVQLEP